jgi:hypothetical protein
MSEKEFNRQLKIIKTKNLTKERKAKLKAEKEKYGRKFKMPSTSKLILLGVILLCIEIVAFCEYVMLALGDTSAMYVLIGIPASLIPIVMSYYSKSKAENTMGGIVFETAMRENGQVKGVESADDEEASG